MEKIKNIKIAFIDIDGTLTNRNKEITNPTKVAINQAKNKGITIVLCSGRTNQYVCNFSKQSFASHYAISCNGAYIYDYQNDIDLFSNALKLELVKKVWNYCLENKLSCMLNCKNIRYYNEYLLNANENSTIVTNQFIHHIEEIKEPNIYQIIIGSNQIEKMETLESFIATIHELKIVNASYHYINKIKNKTYFFDIVNSNVNKGNAIKELLKILNLKKENAICFGDHINDYEMFQEVGFSIAMGNANEKLKKQATYVTLSNDHDGVAYFLNNYIE